MDNNRKKKASESCVEQVYQIRPEHLNGAGRLFGGRLMAWIDEVAGLVGIRHSQCSRQNGKPVKNVSSFAFNEK